MARKGVLTLMNAISEAMIVASLLAVLIQRDHFFVYQIPTEYVLRENILVMSIPFADLNKGNSGITCANVELVPLTAVWKNVEPPGHSVINNASW